MESAVVIGPMLAAGSVREFRGAINDILKSNNDQQTKQAALECLAKGVQMSGGDHNTLSGCSFTIADGKVTKRKRPAAKKGRK